MSPPKLAMSMRCLYSALDTLLSIHLWATLMETTHASPPDAQNSRWLQSSFPPTATWLSLNYGEHNPSHVRRHTLLLNFLITPFRLLTDNISLRDLQHKQQPKFSMLQIKTILKTHFDYRHLTSSSFLYYLTNLARKQLNVNTQTRHNFSSLHNNNI